MLYLIGLGLNEDSLSREALDAISRCKCIYLEGYTVDFPYSKENLEEIIKKKIEILGRKDVESSKLIEEAKQKDIALLVYGSPLFATTHLTLLMDCKKAGVKTKIIYNASVFDAVACSGLQLYKFGKIVSMPAWQKNFSPDSFIDGVLDNLSIKAHSLILCDIGLSFSEAIKQLSVASENKKLKIEKIVVCSQLGTKGEKVLYDQLENLKSRKVELPFCLIVPCKEKDLHFTEKEALESL